MFLSAVDIFTKIVDGFNGWLENIPNWNWDSIVEWLKLSVQTLGIGGIIALLVKVVKPFVEDKTVLNNVIDLANKLDQYKEENSTIKTILTDWVSLQANTNLTSKTLSAEQKQAFLDIAERMKAVGIPNVTEKAEQIEEIVEDGKVTAEETIALAESTKVGQTILGAKVGDIISKG